MKAENTIILLGALGIVLIAQFLEFQNLKTAVVKPPQVVTREVVISPTPVPVATASAKVSTSVKGVMINKTK